MIGTYAAVLAVCGASLTIGQAAIGLCGARRWSWLSPAVGLALLCAVCWGTVRLGGDGVFSVVAVVALVIASVAYLRGRVEGAGEALRAGWPVALLALLTASLPFAVEGHFGILGTSFNPDMSQHLLATDRLAHGHGSQLLQQGYPLGPHSIVVALHKGLGIGLVQGFGGLTVAVAVLAPLTALTAFANLKPIPRTAGALAVGLAYLVASYFAQGAFKETMQALFVLAFALALRESTRSWKDLPLRFLPAALIAVGSVYTYSFPGLIWLIGTAAIWALAQFAVSRRGSPAGGGVAGAPRGAEDAKHPSTVGDATPTGPAVLRPVLLAVLAFAVLVAPEIGRMIDFHRFETFDPNGPGLGNLFGQVSPFEALGIWPSGDFRLAPGDGAMPAAGYYLGIACALALLLHGIVRCWRRRELALLAGFGAAALAYAAARVGGTPYTAAKAIEIAAPLAAVVILLPLLSELLVLLSLYRTKGPTTWRERWPAALAGLAAAGFLLGAAVCSLLALANAPVGPTSYSPALTGLRPLVAADSILVLAPEELLADQHGGPYISWELRGGRVCIAAEGELDAPPPGVRFVVARGTGGQPPFPALRVNRVAPPYVLWEATGPVRDRSPCPLIAVRQARQGPAR
ncbi:MAG TPA: hypothetical protein VFR04_00815 [Solirubrobacterales bacterium]|nr:hypothetical protein [Solirubrobacterales bacterium]